MKKVIFIFIILLLTNIVSATEYNFTFDDNQIPENWTAYGGTWEVSNGILSASSTGHTILQTNISDSTITEIKAQVRMVDDPDYGYSYVGICTKANTLTDFLAIYLESSDSSSASECLKIKKMETSVWSQISRTEYYLNQNQWYILKMQKVDDLYYIYLDDYLIDIQNISMTSGNIALYSYLDGAQINWLYLNNEEITDLPTNIYTFDDNQIPENWTAYGGSWEITDGLISANSASGHTILQTNVSDTNLDIITRIKITDNPSLSSSYGGIATKSNTNTDFVSSYLYQSDSDEDHGVLVKKMIDSSWSQISDTPITFPITYYDCWYIFEIKKRSDTQYIYLNGNLITTTNTTGIDEGNISLYNYQDYGYFDWIMFKANYLNNEIITPEYIYQNENVSISFEALNNITVEIESPSNDIYSKTCDVGQNDLSFPNDFFGSSTNEIGTYNVYYKINENIIETDSFTIRETPLVKFIAATDLHYHTEDWHGTNPSTQINAFVNDINNEKFFHSPDAVFLTGDLYYPVSGAVAVKNILDNLTIPYYPLTGNHDWGVNYDGAESLGSRGTAFYNAFGQKYNYEVQINGIDFVCMGIQMDYPSLVGSYSPYYSQNTEWLNSTLNDNRTNILLSHFVFNEQRTGGSGQKYWAGGDDSADAGGWTSLEEAYKIQNILETYNVPLQMGGHGHYISKTEKNDVTYVMNGALQPSSYSYRYCEIYSDRIEVHTIRQNDDPLDYYIWTTSTDTLHTNYIDYHEGLESEQNFIIYYDVIPTLTPNFTSNVTSGTPPLTVQFTDLSENASEWNWDFDNDGNVDSFSQNPIYTYTDVGTYNVSLTIDDDNEELKLNYITVSNETSTTTSSSSSSGSSAGVISKIIESLENDEDKNITSEVIKEEKNNNLLFYSLLIIFCLIVGYYLYQNKK